MEVDGEYVATPMDHPWAYAPSWRFEVAKLAIRNQHRFYDSEPDQYIRLAVDFLEGVQNDRRQRHYEGVLTHRNGRDSGRYSMKASHDIFSNIGGEDVTKDKLEALLLCPELTLAEISELMGIDPMTIKTYERIYFNIRDDKGVILSSPWLREYFATRGSQLSRNDTSAYWKVLAFEGGHRVLMTTWRWPTTPDMPEKDMLMVIMRNMFIDLESRTRFGTLGNKDLVQLQGNLQASMDSLRDRGMLSSDNVDEDSLLLELLAAAAPEPILPDVSKTAAKQDEVAQKIDVIKTTVRGHDAGSDTLETMAGQIGALEDAKT